MIDILLVSNSAVDKGLLQSALNKKEPLHIVQTVSNDMDDLQALKLPDPNVILVVQQSEYPCNKKSIQFLRETYKAPIIICTSNQDELFKIENTMIFPKVEIRLANQEFEFWLNELTALIRKAADHKTPDQLLKSSILSSNKAASKKRKEQNKKIEIIAIGASTGGPQTLNSFLSLLPKNLKIPVVIVQHMPANFLSVLTGWLKNECPLPIKIAQNNEQPLPGVVYFAPDSYHLTINQHKIFELVDAPPIHNVKPSVSFLFKSVAQVYRDKAIGILLTGMGKDGAEELAMIKEKGGVTFAQNKETSIIFGMPKEAIRLNGATYIMSPANIAQKLREFINT